VTDDQQQSLARNVLRTFQQALLRHTNFIVRQLTVRMKLDQSIECSGERAIRCARFCSIYLLRRLLERTMLPEPAHRLEQLMAVHPQDLRCDRTFTTEPR
jgi:hypothetical protein